MRDIDPRGLIAEAYAMPGIGERECRSVFLDWALGLPEDVDYEAPIRRLLALYSAQAPDHPMTAVLSEGLATGGPPTRRRRGRRPRS